MVVAGSRYCSGMSQEVIKAPDRVVSFATVVGKIGLELHWWVNCRTYLLSYL